MKYEHGVSGGRRMDVRDISAILYGVLCIIAVVGTVIEVIDFIRNRKWK